MFSPVATASTLRSGDRQLHAAGFKLQACEWTKATYAIRNASYYYSVVSMGASFQLK